jgi:hypothetical protein
LTELHNQLSKAAKAALVPWPFGEKCNKMGRGELAGGLTDRPLPGLPENFMERLAPDRVASHIERRRQATRLWAQANPSFVNRFEEAQRKWLAKKAATKMD